MSAPLLWVVFPVVMGIILLIIQRWRIWVASLGIAVLVLLILAWQLPIGEVLVVGPYSVIIGEQMPFAGRQFILAATDRPLLLLLPVATLFILSGSLAAQVHTSFIPSSLIILGFFTAALMIEPVMYAVVFIEIAILFCVLVLSPPGTPPNKGAVRYLVYQTMAVPFLLLAGWLLSNISAGTLDSFTLTRATVMIGVGFAFLFSIFPLYTWIPMLLEDAHPYTAIYVILMSFGVVTLFSLSFIEEVQWLWDSLDLFAGLRYIGVIMVATGGAWAAFQRHLGRILGYAIVIEIGYTLLTIGFQNGDLHYALAFPSVIALAVWGLAVTIVKWHSTDLRFGAIQGFGRQFPVTGAAILIANFSLAGVPLLASFPILLALWGEIAQTSSALAIWSFLGSFGLLVGGLRTFAVLMMGPEELSWEEKERLFPSFFLAVGMAALLLIGLFPHWFFPLFLNLTNGLGFLGL